MPCFTRLSVVQGREALAYQCCCAQEPTLKLGLFLNVILEVRSLVIASCIKLSDRGANRGDELADLLQEGRYHSTQREFQLNPSLAGKAESDAQV